MGIKFNLLSILVSIKLFVLLLGNFSVSLPTITRKIFEANSSFHVKQRTPGRLQISVSQKIFTGTNKIFILGVLRTRE